MLDGPHEVARQRVDPDGGPCRKVAELDAKWIAAPESSVRIAIHKRVRCDEDMLRT